jgi:hypothetical protein
MLTYAAVGTPAQVSDYLDGFIRQTEADELIVVHQAADHRGPAAVGHPAGRSHAGRPRMTRLGARAEVADLPEGFPLRDQPTTIC